MLRKLTEVEAMKTIGTNIALYRKEKGITQEQLAEICNVSPQAVSKWENDVSCPDITLLKPLARTFNISVDELLDDGETPVIRLSDNKDVKEKILKIRAVDNTDTVSLNLPIALIRELLQKDELKNRSFLNIKASKIDFDQILDLIALGVVGKLLECQSENGDFVEIWVE